MNYNNELLKYYKDRFNQCSGEIDIVKVKEQAKIIADEIIDNLKVKSVIEFSCKNGYLLEAFQKKNVEVYAVENLIFPKCQLAESIKSEYIDSLKGSNGNSIKHFDVGIALNIVPYLDDDTAEILIEKLCNCCENVIFSFCVDENEKLLNIHQIEYWSKIFFSFGFVRDLNFTLSKNYEEIYKFSRNKNNYRCIIENYERKLRFSELDTYEEKTKAEKNLRIINELKSEADLLNSVIDKEKKANKKLAVNEAEKDKELKKLREQYQELRQYALKHGFKDKKDNEDEEKSDSNVYVVAKDPNEEELNKMFDGTSIDVAWFLPSIEALNQRRRTFEKNIKFSILCVIDDTKDDYLTEMFDSVVNQTYANWELCIMHVSDADNSKTEQLCKYYAKKYPSVKYFKQISDKGPAENLQAAFKQSSGEYVSLLGKGDILHPAALFETMKVIVNHNADMVYTDEASFKYRVINTNKEFFKPEFSISALAHCNFINRFSSFSVELLKKSGEFNSSVETNEYHDLMFRLAENSLNIYHIQRILYYRREDCIEKPGNAQKAIEAHMKRMGLSAEHIIEKAVGVYDIDYNIKDEPFVSIIVTNIGDKSSLKMCIDSIISNTAYKNYEIIAVDRNYISKQDLIFDKVVTQDLLHCAYLFEKYDALLDKNSLLTEYNKRFSDKEIKKFENVMADLKGRIEKENKKLRDDISSHPQVKLVDWNDKYNKAIMNNYGVNISNGKYCVFIDSQVTVENNRWLDNLIAAFKDKKVGIASSEIIRSYGEVESMGITHSVKKMFRNLYEGEKLSSTGYFGGLIYPNLCSEVWGMCLAVKKEDFVSIGMFSEKYPVYFSSNDLSLRYRENGYLILSIPNSKVENHTVYLKEQMKEEETSINEYKETKIFLKSWGRILNKHDPYYNENFTIKGKTFEKDMSKDTSSNLCLKILEE